MLKIFNAKPGKVYPASLVPVWIGPHNVQWDRLGDDEQYNVIMHRDRTKGLDGIEVIELVWDETGQDWTSTSIDPSTVDLKVYLP